MRRLLTILIGALLGWSIATAQTLAPLTLPPAPNNADIPSLVLGTPTYTNALVLAANTSQTDTIPTNARWLFVSSTCNLYARPGVASTSVPAASLQDGTAPMLNPTAWFLNVQGVTRIAFVSATTCVVTLSYFL